MSRTPRRRPAWAKPTHIHEPKGVFHPWVKKVGPEHFGIVTVDPAKKRSEVRQRNAHLLARIKKNLIFEPIRVLDDGSYLAKIYRNSYSRQKDRGGNLVRIIETPSMIPVAPARVNLTAC